MLGSGEPVATTFIFLFSEVFGGFENMPGGLADTLLALLWTQYQCSSRIGSPGGVSAREEL